MSKKELNTRNYEGSSCKICKLESEKFLVRCEMCGEAFCFGPNANHWNGAGHRSHCEFKSFYHPESPFKPMSSQELMADCDVYFKWLDLCGGKPSALSSKELAFLYSMHGERDPKKSGHPFYNQPLEERFVQFVEGVWKLSVVISVARELSSDDCSRLLNRLSLDRASEIVPGLDRTTRVALFERYPGFFLKSLEGPEFLYKMSPEDAAKTLSRLKDPKSINFFYSVANKEKFLDILLTVEIPKKGPAIQFLEQLSAYSNNYFLGVEDCPASIKILEGMDVKRAFEVVISFSPPKIIRVLEKLRVGRASEIVRNLKTDELLSLFEKMDPKRASQIIGGLDLSVRLDLYNRMSSGTLTAILLRSDKGRSEFDAMSLKQAIKIVNTSHEPGVLTKLMSPKRFQEIVAVLTVEEIMKETKTTPLSLSLSKDRTIIEGRLQRRKFKKHIMYWDTINLAFDLTKNSLLIQKEDCDDEKIRLQSTSVVQAVHKSWKIPGKKNCFVVKDEDFPEKKGECFCTATEQEMNEWVYCVKKAQAIERKLVLSSLSNQKSRSKSEWSL